MPKTITANRKLKRPKKKTISTLVAALHESRIALREAESTLEIEQALFNKKNEKKINAVEHAKSTLQCNDEFLRKAMVDEFEETGQIALGPGLDIRMRHGIECVDLAHLKEWALSKATFLLELDMKKVELIATALPGSLPSTRTTETPTPYVTKDLSKTIESFSKI